MARHGLTKKQQIALHCLLAGKSVAATAETVNVSRSTVHRWMRDYYFQAAINRGHREVQIASRNAIIGLLERATQVVSAAIEQGDVRVALAIFKGAGLNSIASLTASDEDPEHLQKMAELEEKKRLITEQGMNWDHYIRSQLG